MYPEFIAIYVGLIIIIALLVVILVLLLKRSSNSSTAAPKQTGNFNATQGGTGTVVFCKSCATQFDSSQRCCPKCGTPR